jgi:Xaa-Pro aminopeptidase
MSIAERYSEMLRSAWTPEQRRAMKQSAQQYKECVRQAWKKGGVTKAELEACARQAGLPERYHGIISGGV